MVELIKSLSERIDLLDEGLKNYPNEHLQRQRDKCMEKLTELVEAYNGERND
jgi:hypothetical protein